VTPAFFPPPDPSFRHCPEQGRGTDFAAPLRPITAAAPHIGETGPPVGAVLPVHPGPIAQERDARRHPS